MRRRVTRRHRGGAAAGTPLMNAISANNMPLVRELVHKPEALREQNTIKQTPLIVAAIHGNIEAVKLILEAEQDPVNAVFHTDDYQMNASDHVHYAVGNTITEEVGNRILSLLYEHRR